MGKEEFSEQRRIDKSDLISAVLSNLTVIVQIVALGIVGLSNVLQLSNIFLFKEILNITNFIILFVSFSLIGIYSFFKANKDFLFTQPDKKGVLRQINEKLFGTKLSNPLSRQGEKKFVIFLFLITFISSLFFLYSTYKIKFPIAENDQSVFGFIQIISYSLSLICGSVLIFIWIRDQLDKKNQFTEDNFIPNLRSTLIEYEFVKTPEIKIIQNFSVTNGNHLVVAEIGSTPKYLITNFDGKRIFGEITEQEYNNIMNPPQNQKNQV